MLGTHPTKPGAGRIEENPASVVESVRYWIGLGLLTVFGPATLDDEHDPIVALRRKHRRYRASLRRAG